MYFVFPFEFVLFDYSSGFGGGNTREVECYSHFIIAGGA